MKGFFLCSVTICMLLAACGTTKTVEVERVRTDTVLCYSTIRDSIHVSDSVVVDRWMKGDTVFVLKDRWRTEYRDRWRTDTLYKSRTDSVPVPYPVIKEVPAELTWWQKTRLKAFNLLLYLVIIVLVIIIGKKHLKRLMP